MRLVKGEIKVQHGVYRIYEMLEMQAFQGEKPSYPVAGYAIFDLKDQRLSKAFENFQAAIFEINKLMQG